MRTFAVAMALLALLTAAAEVTRHSRMHDRVLSFRSQERADREKREHGHKLEALRAERARVAADPYAKINFRTEEEALAEADPELTPAERDVLKKYHDSKRRAEQAKAESTDYNPYREHTYRHIHPPHADEHGAYKKERDEPPEPIVEIHNYTENLHQLSSSYPEFMVFLYSSEDCDRCDAAMEAFRAACTEMAEEEWPVPRSRRTWGYGVVDVAAMPSERDYLVGRHGYHPFHLPVAVGFNHFDEKAFPTIVEFHTPEQFTSDLLHKMRRIKFRERVGFHDEDGLMAHLYETFNDGVTVVLWTGLPALESRGHLNHLFTQVSRESHDHIHFALYQNRTYWDTRHVPVEELAKNPPVEHDPTAMIEAYNPAGADIVAYVVNEDDPSQFTSELFFAADIVDEPWMERGNYWKELIALRRFVDHAKMSRHKALGRRFRGLKHRLVRHRSGAHPSECATPVLRDDRVVIDLRGYHADTNEKFLDWEEKEIHASDERLHLPYQMRDAFVGRCPGARFEIYVPPHHGGFHPEYYEVRILRRVSLMEQRMRDGLHLLSADGSRAAQEVGDGSADFSATFPDGAVQPRHDDL